MYTCSCCTLIVWKCSSDRSYTKDYRNENFNENPRMFTTKRPNHVSKRLLSTGVEQRKEINTSDTISTRQLSQTKTPNPPQKGIIDDDKLRDNIIDYLKHIDIDIKTDFTRNRETAAKSGDNVDVAENSNYLIEEICSKSVYMSTRLIICILTQYLTDPYFKVINPVPSIVKSGGMIVYKNKILIVQSNFNKWGFPKGHRNSGESVLDCAVREIREETSLVVNLTENDRLLYMCDNTALYYKKLDTKPKINIKQIIQQQTDCTGIAWIRLSCLKKYINGKYSAKKHAKKTTNVETSPTTSEKTKNIICFTSTLRNFVMHYFNI